MPSRNRVLWESAKECRESFMFSYLSSLLVRFQSRPVRSLALAALAVVVAAVLLGSLIRWLRRRRQDRPESWASLLTSSWGAVLKVLIGLGVLAGMCLHLAFQSGEFQRRQGGTSARNYQAVTTIWGRPHHQNELSVRLAYETTHFYDKDGLELDPNRLRAATQPVGFRRQVVEHTIAGNPVVEADHRLLLWTNYRMKGGAWYPGFETEAAFTYRFENFAARDATAHFGFPMPIGQGLVDHISVLLDGQPVRQKLLVSADAIQWSMPLAGGEKHALSVGYHSRGLDHLRFEPGAGRQLDRYRVEMVCRGVAKDQVNYPVGCMTPTEGPIESADRTPDGKTVPVSTMRWNLDHAVTRLGMGVILPARQQPGYYVGRILAAAPWGLVLLLAMVVVTYLAAGQAPPWLPLALLAVGYHLYYLLTAYIAEQTALVLAMVVSAAALTALMAAGQLWLCRPFFARATLGMFVVFTVAWPLIGISDYDGLLTTVLYVLLLGYVVALLAGKRMLDRMRAGAEAEPQPPAA